MHSLIIAIIVLFALFLITVFTDMTIYDCATKQAEYQEKKMRDFDKKNKNFFMPTTADMHIPDGPCSRTSQRIRNGASFVFCAIAALLFVYGFLTGKFDIWRPKNAT